MSSTFRTLKGLFMFVASAIMIGCGTSEPRALVVPTVHAEGVLRHRGEPLPYHQVKVIPENERPAIAVSDENGHFVLGTNRPEDGAVPGTHRVAIIYVGNPEDDPATTGPVSIYTPPPPPSVKIDKKFQSAASSGISVEIPPAGTSDLEIDLQ